MSRHISTLAAGHLRGAYNFVMYISLSVIT